MSTDFLTVEQIANELGMNEETILRWIRKKQLKAYKFARDYRIRRTDYEEFLRERYTGNPNEDEQQEP